MSPVHTFRLNGKDYQLTKEIIEGALATANPKSIDKYYVVINNTKYPPKQALATALNLPLTSFTTLDATRILTNLGIDIIPNDPHSTRNESEHLFEEYLGTYGIDPDYEPTLESTSRKPDYRLTASGTTILCEVKEFRSTPEDFTTGFRAYDPYKPIREKVVAARKKFKDLEGQPCCLVLYNNLKPLVDLNPHFIYAAMLGNLGFTMPLDTATGTADTSKIQNIFTTGGKMGPTSNTTISAIIVLEYLPLGRRRLQAHNNRIEHAKDKKLTVNEFLTQLEAARGTERDPSLVMLRTITHHNPYAQQPLPDALFRGRYDEHYAIKEGTLERTYAGTELQRLQEEERPAAERTALELLRHFHQRGPEAWHSTSLDHLGHIVTSTTSHDLVLILQRLHEITRTIQLRKLTSTVNGWETRLYNSNKDDNTFFVGGNGEHPDFEVRLTPRALLYLT